MKKIILFLFLFVGIFFGSLSSNAEDIVIVSDPSTVQASHWKIVFNPNQTDEIVLTGPTDELYQLHWNLTEQPIPAGTYIDANAHFGFPEVVIMQGENKTEKVEGGWVWSDPYIFDFYKFDSPTEIPDNLREVTQ